MDDENVLQGGLLQY